MNKTLFSVVKFLGVINKYGELKVINLLLYFAIVKLSLETITAINFLFIGVVLIAKSLEDLIEFKRKRGVWDEVVKIQVQHNEIVKWITADHAKRDKDFEDFKVDYTETKRAVNLLNNRSVVEQMRGMTVMKKG